MAARPPHAWLLSGLFTGCPFEGSRWVVRRGPERAQWSSRPPRSPSARHARGECRRRHRARRRSTTPGGPPTRTLTLPVRSRDTTGSKTVFVREVAGRRPCARNRRTLGHYSHWDGRPRRRTGPKLAAPPGDSREQRDAEALMVEALAAQLGVPLAPRRLDLSDGVRVELDAASDDLSVLVEACAHQGCRQVGAAQQGADGCVQARVRSAYP